MATSPGAGPPPTTHRVLNNAQTDPHTTCAPFPISQELPQNEITQRPPPTTEKLPPATHGPLFNQGPPGPRPPAQSGIHSSNNIYFFYDSEGSGGSAMRDHLIEVGVVIYTGSLRPAVGGLGSSARGLGSCESYSSLCQCAQAIEPKAQLKHGIDARALKGQPPVATVLGELFEWVQTQVHRVQQFRGEQCNPIFVSHGGSAFDFPLLVTEVKRSGCEAVFRDLHLQFADTHTLCEQLRAASDPVLRGSKKLTLTELYRLFFPTEQYRAHRALEDALTLCRVFTETPLVGLLSSLPFTSTEGLIGKWCLYRECQELVAKLGLHKQKAKELVQKRVTLRELEREFQQSGCDEQHLRRHLRTLGIKRPREACLGYFRQLTDDINLLQ